MLLIMLKLFHNGQREDFCMVNYSIMAKEKTFAWLNAIFISL